MYNVMNKNELNEYKYTERNDELSTHKLYQISNPKIWLWQESIRHSKMLRAQRSKIPRDQLRKLLRKEAGK